MNMRNYSLLLCPGTVAKYCDEYVRLRVCLCLSPRNSKAMQLTSPNVLCMLPVVVARSWRLDSAVAGDGGFAVCFMLVESCVPGQSLHL